MAWSGFVRPKTSTSSSEGGLTARDLRRRQIDLKELEDYCKTHELHYEVDDEETSTYITEVIGPDDTPYAGHRFRVRISLTRNFPKSSPSVGFMSFKVWHPNVDFESGTICLNLLNERWTPMLTLTHIIDILLPQLLTEPNPDSPLNIEAARQLKSSKTEFEKAAAAVLVKSPSKRAKTDSDE